MTDADAARELVTRALEEDLAGQSDATTDATVPPEAIGVAALVARADGVVAGLELLAEVFAQLDARVRVELAAADGDAIAAGDVVARVHGPLRAILVGERTALNLVAHLSGVATATRTYVEAIAGTGCVVRDNRKTTPGMRVLEKAAVRAGGGVNHRIGLYDGLIVKDNHVAAAGSVTAATRAALEAAGSLPVQVEVDDLYELEEAVAAGARDILLDNFSPPQVAAAVQRVRELEASHGRILLEASGTIRLDTVREFAAAGVDRVSVGAITHSAPQLDLGLDVESTT